MVYSRNSRARLWVVLAFVLLVIAVLVAVFAIRPLVDAIHEKSPDQSCPVNKHGIKVCPLR